MDKQMPKNWVETELESIVVRMTNGSSLIQYDNYFENSFPITRIETIANENFNLEKVKYVLADKIQIDKFKLNRGDILFSHINSDKHLGKTAIYNSDEIIIHGINLLLIRCSKFYNPFLLNYFLKYYRFEGKFMEVAQRAVNQSSINQKKLNSFIFPLPPLAEQNRIVTKLDTLFAQLENIKTNMEKIPVLLKNFRQQVLTQAVTGKLTDCKVKKERLGALLIDVKYGTSKKSDYEIDGTPIFRIPNIKDGEIDDVDLKFSILEKKEYEQLQLKKGDVLIIRSNGSVTLVGKSAIIRDKHIGFSYAGYLIRLRCGDELIPDFLNYTLQSDFLRSQIVQASHSSSGVNNINSQEIKDLTIYSTSPKEQQEIIFRVESLFAKADAIEKQYETLIQKIDTLPQAILHKAFKGELTEQLDSDDDARELLRQIQELKATANKTVKKVSKTAKIS